MDAVNLKNWCGHDIYQLTDAAYLWLGQEPRDGEPSTEVLAAFKLLSRNINLTIVIQGGFLELPPVQSTCWGDYEDSSGRDAGYLDSSLLEYTRNH